MSSPKSEAASQQPSTGNLPPKALPKRNPVAEMMGLPRLRLPSRNWLIFLSITGAFLGAVTYDRREKKRIQKKWCDTVSHLAQDPLPTTEMRSKLTIFLAAPPGDGLRTTRDYFREYVKPVLVSAALDYDVIEGRKEGDVRFGTAEQIRRIRRKNGEQGQEALHTPDPEQLVDIQRARVGIREEPGPKGDLVIGRHAWKEYVRGLHEGWLGPLDPPPPPPAAEDAVMPELPPGKDDTAPPPEGSDDKAESKEDPKPVDKRASYLTTTSYPTSTLAPTTPAIFAASAALPQPHILGFLNTPIRLYRYLNERKLADQIGRETAAVVLGMTTSYETRSGVHNTPSDIDASPTVSDNPADISSGGSVNPTYEQQDLLRQEEAEWHKSVRKPQDDGIERTWLDDVVIDSRIAERMRKFQLDPAEDERAGRIAQGLEKPLKYQEKEEDRKIILGNLDDPNA